MDRDDVLKAMTLALRTGEVMLESTVAVSDVDRALRQLTASLGLPECHVSVTLNVITLSYLGPYTDAPVTMMSAVDEHEPRIHRLIAVEKLNRRVQRGEVALADGYREILEIETSPEPYGPWAVFLASLVSVAAWVVFAGGAGGAVVAALAAWVIVVPLLRLVGPSRLPNMFAMFAAAGVVTLVPYLFYWAGFTLRVPAAVAGGLYPLLPGGLLVASVVDGISSAPISSLAKALQAGVVALSLALGVILALHATIALEIEPRAVAERWPIAVSTLAAGIALAGLAIARSAPTRTVPWIAGLGMAIWAVAWLGPQLDIGRDLTTFAAAILLGVAGQSISRVQHTSATVYTSVAVYVLVPGVLIYLATFLFVQGSAELGRDLAVEAVRIAGAIAAGVALGIAVVAAVPSPSSRTRLWHRRGRSTAG